ncbi:hypothetical protein [Ureibacillus sp. FSL E2-3493]|uniref:hypothetical protein n=1 Tax=Ureibacillus sp. FSL E2-3493 TaxID=2921367 RepID=UPI00311A8C48
MAKKQTVNVYAYKISTPAIDTARNVATDGYYNHQLFEGFLNEIISNSRNKILESGKYIHLIGIKQSSDADVLEGLFHTTRYGTKSDIIDVSNDKVVSQLEPMHGVKNIVNFVIHRKSGILLIQNDPFKLIQRNNLIDFLERNVELGKKHVTKFNIDFKPLLVSNSNFYTIQTIYDEDFYQQLAKIANIKAVSINTKVQKESVNTALSKFTHSGVSSDDYLDDVTDVTYTFKNSRRNNGVKHVKNFIKNALDLEKIDTIIAHGSNKEKVEFNKIKPRKYQITTTINDSKVLDQSKIIEGMIKIVKEFKE